MAKSLMSLDVIQKARSMASKAIIVALGTSCVGHSESAAPCQKRSLPPFAERDLWNIDPAANEPHSAWMLRARITLPHFSVSSAISLPNWTGDPGSSVPPRSARRAFILGSSRAALTSLLSLLTISAGVAFGTPRPNHLRRLLSISLRPGSSALAGWDLLMNGIVPAIRVAAVSGVSIIASAGGPPSRRMSCGMANDCRAYVREYCAVDQRLDQPSQRYQHCRQTQNCHCKKYLRVGRHLCHKLDHLP